MGIFFFFFLEIKKAEEEKKNTKTLIRNRGIRSDRDINNYRKRKDS